MQYAYYSSILKEKSSLLKNLKIKIESLRKELKRPNEILIKYRELVKSAKKYEDLRNQIENELLMTELEIAKQQFPW